MGQSGVADAGDHIDGSHLHIGVLLQNDARHVARRLIGVSGAQHQQGTALFRALQDVDLCIACGPFQVRIVVREHAHFGHVLSGDDVFDKMTLLIETASRDPSDHSGAGQDHDRADI